MRVLAFFIYWRRTGSARHGAPERKGCWRSERSDPCKWPQKRKGDRLRQTETPRRRELVRLRYPVPRRLRQLPLRRVRFAVGQSRESVAALSCRLLLFASSFSLSTPREGINAGPYSTPLCTSPMGRVKTKSYNQSLNTDTLSYSL